MQAFYDMMARDSARAFYGPGHVQAAHELGAIQTLLITDTLFRVNNVAQVPPSSPLPACLILHRDFGKPLITTTFSKSWMKPSPAHLSSNRA